MRARLVPLLFLVACDANSDTDATTTKHGHDGLIDGPWSGEVFRDGDATIDLGFEFGSAAVNVSNTCRAQGRELRAELTIPVDYTYAVTVANDAAAGSVACGLTLQSGRYDFLIIDGGIRVLAGADVFDLARLGTTDGLFGTWGAPTADSGTLTWTFASNALQITRTCPGISSEPVVLTVAASVTSYVEFGAEDTKTEVDGDFECTVTTHERRASYVLDGDTLKVTDDGDTVTLTREVVAP